MPTTLNASAMEAVKDRVVALTGGTGSWGQQFATQLLKLSGAREVRVISRGESSQVAMRERFAEHSGRLKLAIGDVRDLPRLMLLLRGVDIVIHLAALKHVPVIEEQPREALRTNTEGTQNVIDASAANGVHTVMLVSSDKAVDPLNFYGVTKLAAERLVLAAHREQPGTRFYTFRSGNAIGSSGSVLPLFRQQIARDNRLELTDRRMTRFFIRLPDAVGLALNTLTLAQGGEIYVPKMRSTDVDTLARVVLRRVGNAQTSMVEKGARDGEKMDELLLSRNETRNAVDHDPFWVVLPVRHDERLVAHYAAYPRAPLEEYNSSNAQRFSETELEEQLEKDGFLKPLW
jgi:UDP-N-acetylglucosamine 4,6-dehydratase/5-epimerase